MLNDRYLAFWNIWIVILSAVALIGWIAGILFLFRNAKVLTGKYWLAAILLSFSFTLTSYILYWTEYNTYFPYLDHWWKGLVYLTGPALLFYLRQVFQEEFSRRAIFLHFTPILLVLLLLLPALLFPYGIRLNWSQDIGKIGSSAYFQISHLVLYGVWCHQLAENDWKVDMNIKFWTRIITTGFWVYILSFISYFVLSETSFFSNEWDYCISLVMALAILMIAWMGFVQRKVFESQPVEQFIPIIKYQSSGLTKEATNSIKKRLELLLKEQEVYKENELRLDDLAAYIGVSRHHLSQVINEHYQINYFEFINSYRINWVKKMLKNPAYNHHTITQLAYESGFNNKASFNKFFKKDTGMTPSAYRLKVNANSSVKSNKF